MKGKKEIFSGVTFFDFQRNKRDESIGFAGAMIAFVGIATMAVASILKYRNGRCVYWDDPEQSDEAMHLLRDWLADSTHTGDEFMLYCGTRSNEETEAPAE